MAATWTSFVTSLPPYKPSSSTFNGLSFPRQSSVHRFSRIYALSSNDIKVGTSIEVDGAPWRVLEFLHVKPGKGAAFVRTKIRNYVNGSTVERTFRAEITMEEANVFKETNQFTYKDGSQFVFIDLTSYEETRLNEADMGDKTKWLKEGMDCNLLYWKDKLDVRTNLCIRDSLYRLAKSAEQRHICMDPNGGNRQVKGAGSHLETRETDKYGSNLTALAGTGYSDMFIAFVICSSC